MKNAIFLTLLQHFSFQDRWSSTPLVTGVHFYIHSTQGIKGVKYQYMKVTGWSWFDTAGTSLKEASSFETCVIPLLFIRKNTDQKSTFYGNYHTHQDYITTERETQKTEFKNWYINSFNRVHAGKSEKSKTKKELWVNRKRVYLVPGIIDKTV